MTALGFHLCSGSVIRVILHDGEVMNHTDGRAGARTRETIETLRKLGSDVPPVSISLLNSVENDGQIPN